MARFTVSPTHHFLLKDQKPFFYLADTVWAAFLEAPEDEWQEFLLYRSKQGFNTLQISLLPILHDASSSDTTILPFHQTEDGLMDFFQLNEMYFARVARMVEQAAQYGLTCALVLIWCNYAPDTWISQQSPAHIIPFEAIQPYVEYVVKLLDRYDPIYLISGDTDFRSQRTIDTYLEALKTVKRLSPGALACMHISPYIDLPASLVAEPDVDFYMYQSGHRLEEQAFIYTLAEKFSGLEPHRPTINGEPCYESAGHGRRYGRFTAFDLRKAFWSGVLSGASAGFTYGAHGVWSWHRRNAVFMNEDWSKTPFDWRTAMQLSGSWDVCFSAWLFEHYQLFSLESANHIRKTPYEEIRVATTPDQEKLVTYLPYPVPLEIQMDLSSYTFEGFDLGTRQIFHPRVRVSGDGTSTIEMSDFNGDTLFIGVRSKTAGTRV